MKEAESVMGWYQDGMGGGGWTVMVLAMVALWVLVVFGVVAVFRGTGNTGAVAAPRQREPVEILEERFARGQIDADEYHVRLDVLRGTVR